MKKIIIFSALLFSFALSKAQGNLQFNRVVVYDIQGASSTAFIVPAGKVWKIEMAIVVGGDMYVQNSASQDLGTLNSSSGNTRVPFWLPGSFVGSFYCSASSSNRGAVSIIEFNIVP